MRRGQERLVVSDVPNTRFDTKLPAYTIRERFANGVRAYNTSIVQGFTGCGKTTQMPVYVLYDCIMGTAAPPRTPMIYVTQPRRIAAKSVAIRVCKEHGWPEPSDIKSGAGSIVGYQIGLEKRVGPNTVLIYCTAGVLLQKLINRTDRDEFTHIFLDEAHERDADTDLLMMMVKRIMKEQRSTLKVVVMSATIDTKEFYNYYTTTVSYGHSGLSRPHILKIPRDDCDDKIKVLYYDKFAELYDMDEPTPKFDLDSPELYEEMVNAAIKLILHIIPRNENFNENTRSTLVFLPGLAEISNMHRLLQCAESELDIIPLHSCISIQDQSRVFTSSRKRKVILATNIAESSITVWDVGFVIDFCLTKVLKKDRNTKIPALRLEWSTVDRCIQRMGRTGRCCPGRVFRMISQNFFDNVLMTHRLYAEPELLIAPLELSVLNVKNFDMGDVNELLQEVLTPPNRVDVESAVLELKQIGAIGPVWKGQVCHYEGDLTELGRIISKLPIDVHFSKLIVIAHLFDVLEDAVHIAACLSTNRNVIKTFVADRLRTYETKLNYSLGSYSDLFVSLYVFKDYLRHRDDMGRDKKFLRNYCIQRNLDERKLFEVYELVRELKMRLRDMNIATFEEANRERNVNEDELMLKVALCGAFFPNYFISQEIDPEEVHRSLSGLDPSKTLVVSHLPINEVALYRQQIVRPLSARLGTNIDYIVDCSKAMLSFQDDRYEMVDNQKGIAALGDNDVVESTRCLSKSMFLAIKIGDHNEVNIREYQPNAAADRMDNFKLQRAKLQSPNRLAPSLMKIVSCEPNNDRLTTISDSNAFCQDHEYYMELKADQKQEIQDLETLAELYANEEKHKIDRICSRKFRSGRDEGIQHPVYKFESKLIKGPQSPIRIKWRSVVRKTVGYNVDVDPNSINTILLDPEYRQCRRQMLVAASVSHSNDSRVLARDTTLMPNIRGLPSLMALLFAQNVRMICHKDRKLYLGALFGLGWRSDGTPISRDYEIELGFDVLFTCADLRLINQARKTMCSLTSFADISNPGAREGYFKDRLRKIIIALMKTRRFPIQETVVFNIYDISSSSLVLDLVNLDEREMIDGAAEAAESRRLASVNEWPNFLAPIKLTIEFRDIEAYDVLRENLDHLERIKLGAYSMSMEGEECHLCNKYFMSYSKIKEHLEYDERHINNLEMLHFFEARARETEASMLATTTTTAAAQPLPPVAALEGETAITTTTTSTV